MISPSLDDVSRLRTTLTEGEARVLYVLNETLPEGWEIYIQPYLNGCRPDFVIINETVGICVLEVKDWSLKTLLASRSKGHDPSAAILRYKSEIYELYCPRLKERAGFAAIATSLIFPEIDGADLHCLYRNASTLVADGDYEGTPLYKASSPIEYDGVFGGDSLAPGHAAFIAPGVRRSSSRVMSQEAADDLRSWLIEPDHAAEQRDLWVPDETQRQIIETRTATGYRRVKGPAGSGKSFVLAARAARLASEGKHVLVVSFNLTLLHYLRDICARVPLGRPNRITWLNFHHLCKRLFADLGLWDAYAQIWRDHFADGDRDSAFDKVPEYLRAHLTANPLPDDARYDAILVDEGQDFAPDWWSLLRFLCRPGSEMMLVADATQDIYGSARRWTDEAMASSGFRGPWSRLNGSYRLPDDVARIAADFIARFMSRHEADPPDLTPRQAELGLTPVELRWVQVVGAQDRVDICIDELLGLIVRHDKADRAMTDLTLLVSSKETGRAAAEGLRALGINTVDTFVDGNERNGEDRRKKMAFWKSDARVKVTTLYSFKGWEARLLVVEVASSGTDRDRALIYTGITRLKRSLLGSCLTIVCSDRRLAEYGRSWPEFREVGSDASS
jgi:hypothetical protein